VCDVCAVLDVCSILFSMFVIYVHVFLVMILVVDDSLFIMPAAESNLGSELVSK